MKLAKIVSLLFLCALIGFADFSAEAQFKKLKKKVEKKIDKLEEKEEKKKQKKEEKAAEEKFYAENFGTGVRKTGGTYAGLEMAKLQDSDDLKFKCVAGKCNSVTVHGRTSNGMWYTLYQGQLKDVNVGTAVAGKRNNYTHLLVSVNGAHESYDKTAAKLEIAKVAGKGGSAPKADTAVKPDADVKPDTAVKPDSSDKSDKKDTPSGVVNAAVNQAVKVTVNGGEFGYVTFTIKDKGETNYRVNVWDKESKAHFTQQMFSDSGYTKEISGKSRIDYGHPLGGTLFAKDYKLKEGTYYLKIKNERAGSKATVEVNLFKYNPAWDSER